MGREPKLHMGVANGGPKLAFPPKGGLSLPFGTHSKLQTHSKMVLVCGWIIAGLSLLFCSCWSRLSLAWKQSVGAQTTPMQRPLASLTSQAFTVYLWL